MLSLPRAWVQSLVRKLRSHKPCSVAPKKENKTNNNKEKHEYNKKGGAHRAKC